MYARRAVLFGASAIFTCYLIVQVAGEMADIVRSWLERFSHAATYCAAWMSLFLFVGGGTAAVTQVTGLYDGLWLDRFHSEHGTWVIPFTGVMLCVYWPVLGLCTRAMQKGAHRLGVFLSWDAACAASWFGFMACTWPVGILLVNKTSATGLFFLGFFFNYWWKKPKKEPMA